MIFRSVFAICLLSMPAVAQEWQVNVNIDPPLAYSNSYAGSVSSWGTGQRGERFGNVEAFRGPGVVPNTPCADVDWFEVDFFFGADDHHEIQFLFGLDRQPDGDWRVDAPAAFINLVADGDSTAVYLEQYEGPRVDVTEVTCQEDGMVRVAMTYAFAGQPQSEKGPDWLSLHGSASATMVLYNYDQY